MHFSSHRQEDELHEFRAGLMMVGGLPGVIVLGGLTCRASAHWGGADSMLGARGRRGLCLIQACVGRPVTVLSAHRPVLPILSAQGKDGVPGRQQMLGRSP